METYHGRVRKGLSRVKISVIDDSGILKYQDDVQFVIHKNGEVTLLIDTKKAIERQREDWDRQLNIPLP